MSYIKKEELIKKCEKKFAEYRNRRPYRPIYFIDENNNCHYDFFDKFTVNVLKSVLECPHNNVIMRGESCVLNKKNEAYLCNIKGEGNKIFIYTGLMYHIESCDDDFYQCVDEEGKFKLASRGEIIPAYDSWVITKC